ncbi:MAG: hypothetical protein QME63_04135 [Actinomycetota bacterium]|nr:hypothetical protein [Actinomycetota bacterium]
MSFAERSLLSLIKRILLSTLLALFAALILWVLERIFKAKEG